MSFVPSLKLPLIDLSESNGSKLGTGRGVSLQSQVRQALEEFGCFEASYDKMTPQLHDDVSQELKELFELPADVKRRVVVSGKPFYGYFANHPLSPLHEAFGMGYAHNSGSINKLADLVWPEGNTRFCETMGTCLTRAWELDSLVRKLVLRSLGVDSYMDSLAESITYNFRLMKYAAPGSDKSKSLEMVPHRDSGFLSFLHQNQVNGLEVQTKDGRWFEVAPSSATSFFVLAGESFYGWSNGRLYSPPHRVMMSGHETRYSIGFFSTGQGTIQCPQELVDEQHPLLFKPFDTDGLNRVYQIEEGQNGASAMDIFYRI